MSLGRQFRGKVTEGNCITIDPITGTAFYRGCSFIGRGHSGASVNVVRCSELTTFSGLFIACRITRYSSEKASYSRLLNGERLRKGIVKLPIKRDGEPDWAFMEQYMINKIAGKV